MNNQDVATAFKQLNIIYLALITGQLAFASVVYFLSMDEEASGDDLGVLKFIVPILSLVTIGVSYFIYNKLIQKGQAIEGLGEKLAHYRTTNIIRWALVEGGNLFAIVIFLISGETYLLMFFALGFVVFLMYRPSKDGFISNYNLSGSERLEVERF